MKRSKEEWRERLSAEAYRVTREGGTERPYFDDGWKDLTPGTWHCVCCGTRLFRTEHKFVAHCGWPSFDREAADAAPIQRLHDASHGMVRTEVRCGVCDAHLGHVFEDGPTETGERYCINSVSIVLHPETPSTGEPEKP